MFPEKLTRFPTGDERYVYVAGFHSAGARKCAYALYKDLKQWWKTSVDTTNEQGEVCIVRHDWGGYHVEISFTDGKNVLLFKLRFEHNETNVRFV